MDCLALPVRFLAISILAAAAGAAEVRFADRPQIVTAMLERLDASVLELGAGAPPDLAKQPAALVLELDTQGAFQPLDDDLEVRLWTSDVLRGRLVEGDAASLTIESTVLGRVVIALTDIAEIVMPRAERLPLAAKEEDVARMNDGDEVRGVVASFSSDGITLENPHLGRIARPLADLAQVAFANLGGATTSPELAGRRARVALRDGSAITAGCQGIARGALELTTIFGPMSIPMTRVVTIVFLTGDFVLLSDLEPVIARYEPPFPSELVMPELVVDGAVTGGPLVLGGRRFTKGLGVHARSVLAFESTKGSLFLATAGLDASARGDRSEAGDAQLASVIFRVSSGSRANPSAPATPLWESPILRAESPPIEVGPLEVPGDLLILEVEMADNTHVLDRAGWGNARLVSRH